MNTDNRAFPSHFEDSKVKEKILSAKVKAQSPESLITAQIQAGFAAIARFGCRMVTASAQAIYTSRQPSQYCD
ncbi:hypothetical protein PGT21_031579 [Puccinia graminis f. sp. tritici]|uniref:Uncharacterized protein n=1 Tax=Puccinia graminis f. sp. tritici TaxID=56615 RepID=A0A5B0PJM1_PUCGR|nr:hypothetical protein PGT21_031579 [Puccinia graminis f. sp. tritici]